MTHNSGKIMDVLDKTFVMNYCCGAYKLKPLC